MSIRSCLLNMLFYFSTCLLIFCLVVLLVLNNVLLKSPVVIVDFNYINFCFMCLGDLFLDIYTFSVALIFWWIDSFILCNIPFYSNFLCSEVYFIRYWYSHSCYLWLIFVCYIFLHPFKLPMPFNSKWDTYKQHIVGWYFFHLLC